MSRPLRNRRVSGRPVASAFNPAGERAREADEVVMTLDEFEAIRLADHDGLYQEQAAGRMEVSRPTFGRILESAHHKIAEALIRGRTLKIEGGAVHPDRARPPHSRACEPARARHPEDPAARAPRRGAVSRDGAGPEPTRKNT